MLVALWSPKGGSGTSVVAAACALVLVRPHASPARLVDLARDQAALLGLGRDPATGVGDWLAAGAEAPAEALEQLAVGVAPQLELLPTGRAEPARCAPEAGAALGVLLRDDPRPTVADAGHGEGAASALLDVADHRVIVVRGCYLALRRGVRADVTQRADGAVLVEEPGRALGAREVADVLGVPVLATVPLRPSVARVVDAGVLTSRPPEALLRPVRRLLDRLGARRDGRAA